MMSPEQVLARMNSLQMSFRARRNPDADEAMQDLTAEVAGGLRDWEASVLATAERREIEASREAAKLRAIRDRWIAVRSAQAQRAPSAPTVLVTGPEEVAIYALIDPHAPAVVRYVGQSVSPHSRYRGHLRSLGWARDLVAIHRRYPTMLLLEWCEEGGSAIERERHWIRHYRGIGMADLNVSLHGVVG